VAVVFSSSFPPLSSAPRRTRAAIASPFPRAPQSGSESLSPFVHLGSEHVLSALFSGARPFRGENRGLSLCRFPLRLG